MMEFNSVYKEVITTYEAILQFLHERTNTIKPFESDSFMQQKHKWHPLVISWWLAYDNSREYRYIPK
ncbi:unnamed protein product [Rhizophagus irregularis]|nr:unnamed protein product [Rhizophagus irregularis]